MFTVFLAFVVFADMAETPPRIVASYKDWIECVTAARQRNAGPLVQTPKPGTGYICLEVRGDT